MIYRITFLVTVLCAVIDSCYGSKSVFCTDKLNSHDKNEAHLGLILKQLSELNLATEVKNGSSPPTEYKIAVCGDASPSDPSAGAVRTTQNKQMVLGRVNSTQAVLGDTWMMVMLGAGDSTINGTNCNGSHAVTILFLCNEKFEGKLQFVKESDCTCIMEVETSAVCPQKVTDDSTSHTFIFFSLVFCFILIYFLCGALYRRFVLGAKGVEQIPHIAFWSQLFENCRMFCRRRRRSSTSLWHGNEDRDDDSLLQP